MNGQNQYDPATGLTSHPTLWRPLRRAALAARYRSVRHIGAIGAGALVLALLLPAVADGVTAPLLAAITGGAWFSMVLGMSFPGRHERPGPERARRLAEFRQEVGAAGDEPSRDDLEHLLALARDLQPHDAEIADDLARIRASLVALELREQLQAGVWPHTSSPDPLSASDACHFVCPVRFGRRRADQYGHLVLTRLWLKFRGALDMSVAWSEVASIERAGRDLIVSLHDSRRVLRFSCHTFDEAARAGVIATALSRRIGEGSARGPAYDLV